MIKIHPSHMARVVFTGFFGIFILPHMHGQAVIGSAAGLNFNSPSGSGQGLFGNAGFSVTPLSSIASALSKSGPLFKAGSVEVRPHASYQWVEGSGILVAPGAEDKVTTRTFTPGVTLNLGARTSADYTFTRTTYSAARLADTSDHNFRVSTGLTAGEWKFGLSGSYGTSSNILAETARQTRDETYSTYLNVSHQIGRATEVEASLSNSIRSASAITAAAGWKGTDWTSWNATTRVRHHLSSQVNFSGGLAAGYDQIDGSPDMSSLEPKVDLNWKPTSKLSLVVDLGLRRHSTKATPVYTQNFWTYGVSGSYSLLAATTFSLSGQRSIYAAYFGQAIQGDTWTVSLQQRLLTRFFFAASYSHSYSNLHFTTSNTIARFPDRIDRGNTVHASLSTALFGRASFSIFYQRGQNRSSDSLFGYSNNQVGASASYSF